MPRRLLTALVAGALLSGPGTALAPSGQPVTGRSVAPPAPALRAEMVGYRAPLPGPLRVLRGFDPPVTPYGPGHLGADLAAAPGARVLAAGPGVVRFAGPVAGRGVVVVAHRDGISTEYEPVRPLVGAGVAVAGGQVVGTLAGRHRGCTSSCLHWGARRGDRYLDPLGLLRPLGPVRLLPWSST